jgi:hypothetical protein
MSLALLYAPIVVTLLNCALHSGYAAVRLMMRILAIASDGANTHTTHVKRPFDVFRNIARVIDFSKLVKLVGHIARRKIYQADSRCLELGKLTLFEKSFTINTYQTSQSNYITMKIAACGFLAELTVFTCVSTRSDSLISA